MDNFTTTTDALNNLTNNKPELDAAFSMIEEHVSKQTKKEIKAIKNAAHEEINSLLYELQIQSQHDFSRLEKLFSDNRAKWESDVFQSVIENRV